MKILLVDDESLSIKSLYKAVREVCPNDEIKQFTDPFVALGEITSNEFVPDVAFLDIEMPEMNGIELAHRLKGHLKNLNIIFATAYSDFMGEAFSLRASGYLLKPINAENVKTELENLRNPVTEEEKCDYKAVTFGNFGFFYKNKPVIFKRIKSKELLAYLIDRKGVEVSRKEAASVLFDESTFSRAEQNQLSIIYHDLISDLKKINAEKIVNKTKSGYSVNIDEFVCDSYRYLKGDPKYINRFKGEYMNQYSWAEYFKNRFYE